MTTVAELRGEIRATLEIPDYERGSSGLSSRTLETALEGIGGTPWGGAPSMRSSIRKELGLIGHSDDDSKPLRKAELVELRDALQEGRE